MVSRAEAQSASRRVEHGHEPDDAVELGRGRFHSMSRSTALSCPRMGTLRQTVTSLACSTLAVRSLPTRSIWRGHISSAPTQVNKSATSTSADVPNSEEVEPAVVTAFDDRIE